MILRCCLASAAIIDRCFWNLIMYSIESTSIVSYHCGVTWFLPKAVNKIQHASSSKAMPSRRSRSRSRDRHRDYSRDRSRRSHSPERHVKLPSGASPITEGDYFRKFDELRLWLKEERGKVRILCYRHNMMPHSKGSISTNFQAKRREGTRNLLFLP